MFRSAEVGLEGLDLCTYCDSMECTYVGLARPQLCEFSLLCIDLYTYRHPFLSRPEYTVFTAGDDRVSGRSSHQKHPLRISRQSLILELCLGGHIAL